MSRKVENKQGCRKGYCEEKEEQGTILENGTEEKANVQKGIKVKQRRDGVNDDDQDGEQ